MKEKVSHWYLVVISIDDRTVYNFDSKHDSSKNIGREKKLRHLVRKYYFSFGLFLFFVSFT